MDIQRDNIDWSIIISNKDYSNFRINKIDILGLERNKLTVVTNIVFTYKEHKDAHCLAKCSCGSGIKNYRLSDLKLGIPKSCGCARIESRRARKNKHNMTGTRVHQIWMGMKSRCSNNNHTYNTRHYRDFGISVCHKWKNDFMEFYEWSMENGYKDDLLIDRIDNEKNYCPENCRWVTKDQNNLNRRGVLSKQTSSQYKGIYFRKDTNRWSAKISFEGKHYQLGCYETESEAAQAYNKKASELFKEFAYINKVIDE